MPSICTFLLVGWCALTSVTALGSAANEEPLKQPAGVTGDDKLAYFESRTAFRAWVRDLRLMKLRRSQARLYRPIEEVVVTGAKTTVAAVTNNQSAGVDEGDVVKLIGHYLVDRANVYRVASDDAWYDEIMVHDRYLFVSRYSYDDGESAIEVFSLGNAGKLRWEARYRIRSSDYFSSSNYAMRLAGDRLVMYLPVPLDEYARGHEDEVALPALQVQIRSRTARTFAVLPATRIPKPSLGDESMQLHVLLSCSLAELPDIKCQGEAAVGPQGVNPVDDRDPARAPRAVAYRFAIDGGTTAAARTFGLPTDQFALRETADGLHALLRWPSSVCGTASPWEVEHAPRLAHIPNTGFDTTLHEPAMDDYHVLPGNDDGTVRLTDALAIYANTRLPREPFSND